MQALKIFMGWVSSNSKIQTYYS
uniref:Uncharacterized protein n=1 Tax=Rhizophora mucronata TaxID=61149 RepID=A0A2P2J0V3_RHIMU